MMRLLLLTENISHYNRRLFIDLAKCYELTVGFTRKDEVDDVPFEKVLLSTVKFGPLIIVTSGLFRLCRNSHLVIIMPDLHYLSFIALPFVPFRQFRVISWGIGMRASYTNLFNVDRKHSLLDHIYKMLLYRCDRNIFYSEKALEFWKDVRIEKKSRVAVNTLYIDRSLRFENSEKNIFLFVGSLYKEKGVEVLLKNYSKLFDKYDSKVPTLVVIGDGEELLNLECYTERNGLKDKVIFLGRIVDEEDLAFYFNKSLCLITPYQAGLTVLKSLFYGVPVITSRGAITGGELYNIIHDFNGHLFTNDDEIYIYLDRYMNDRPWREKISKNAIDYFELNVSYERQLDSFKQVLNELV